MRKIAEAKSVEAAAALPDPLKEALKKPPSPTIRSLSETLVKRQPSCWSELFFLFFSVSVSSFDPDKATVRDSKQPVWAKAHVTSGNLD